MHRVRSLRRNMSCKRTRTRITWFWGTLLFQTHFRLLKQFDKNINVFVVLLTFFTRDIFVKKQSTCLNEHITFENQYFKFITTFFNNGAHSAPLHQLARTQCAATPTCAHSAPLHQLAHTQCAATLSYVKGDNNGTKRE